MADWVDALLTEKVDDVRFPGYYERHALCPCCGSRNLTQTIMGILAGEDINRATCHAPGCGWSGRVADLRPTDWLPVQVA